MKYNDIKDAQQQDAYLSKLMKNQFDQELKDKWAKQLQTDYATQPKATQTKDSSLIRKLFPYVTAIAACFVLVFAYTNLQSDGFNPESYLVAELKNPILHPGNTKGVIEDSNIRQDAIAQFNEQNFSAAANSYAQIEDQSVEDQFYQAMAHFYLKQSDKAIPILEGMTTTKSNFSEEINWYLGLSYIDIDNLPAAKTTLSRIQSTDWNYAKAQEILEAL